MLLGDVSWEELEKLRSILSAATQDNAAPSSVTVQMVAQRFAATFAQAFPSIVLARVFLVQPWSALPPSDQTFAAALVNSDARLADKTPVLSLLGSHGKEPQWCDRQQSREHLAIPLLDRTFVQGAPMLAKLLSDLEVNLAGLDDGRPIATRRMLGGRNGTFFVPDAQTARDAANRPIIPAQAFVERYGVSTVFGMGGAYADGTLAVAIFFTVESLSRLQVDKFPSFISNFKMASAPMLSAGLVY